MPIDPRTGQKFTSGFKRWIPDPFLTEAGRLIISWGYVEGIFDIQYLDFVIGGSSTGYIEHSKLKAMLGDKSFDTRCQLFRERMREMEFTEQTYRQIDSLLSRLSGVKRKRDFLVHAMWVPIMAGDRIDQTKAQGLHRSWKKKEDYKGVTLSIEDIQATMTILEQCQFEVSGLMILTGQEMERMRPVFQARLNEQLAASTQPPPAKK